MMSVPRTDDVRFDARRLFAPLTVAEFIGRVWPDEVFAQHPGVEALGDLRDVPELSSVESVLVAYRERPDLLQTWFPEGTTSFVRTGHVGLALDDYRRRARLQFNQVEACVPSLRVYQERLARALGLPFGSVSSTIIASTTGAFAPPHFDSNPSLTVQLRGSKRWRVGPRVCANTLHSFVLGHSDARLLHYAAPDLPSTMPADARVVDMRDGSVIFMPRGVLHEVRSGEDTLSLAFDVLLPTWSDLVLREVRHRLESQAAWRAFAFGAAGEEPAAAEAARALSALLLELPAAATAIAAEPDAILRRARPSALAGLPEAYRRAPRATLEHRRDGGANALIVAGADGGVTEIELPDEMHRLASWLEAREHGFTTSEAMIEAHVLELSNVREVLEALTEAGAIIGVRASGAAP